MPETAPAGRPGSLALLALQAGPRAGEELPVPAPVVTLGRGAACDVVLSDDSVSATHARLEFDRGAWRITDLDSVNGTAVEGVRLAPQVPTPLPYGSSVRLGGVTLQLRAVQGADPDAARAGFVPRERPATLREERAGPRFPLWAVLLAVLLLVAAALFALGVVELPAQPAPGAAAPAPAPLAAALPR